MRPPVLPPIYDGTFSTDIDGAIEVLYHHQFLHGMDKISGALQSMISFADHNRALASHWHDLYDKLVEDKIASVEVVEVPEKKKRVRKNG